MPVVVVVILGALIAAGLACSSNRSASSGAPSTAPAGSRSSSCPSASATAPTVVMVHGAWADTSGWDGEIAALRRAGIDARAVANPLQDLTSDAASVAAFLRTVDGDIVLVGHSYGGSVITNAAAGNPNVKALVYVDAAAPDVGETTAQLSGAGSVLGGDPDALYDTVDAPPAPPTLYLEKDVFIDSFASSLRPEEATRLWATQRAASTAAFQTPSTAAAWSTIPSWSFISTGDRIITPESQRAMARRAGSKVTEFDGGSHLTLISSPDAVAAVIRSAVCGVR